MFSPKMAPFFCKTPLLALFQGYLLTCCLFTFQPPLNRAPQEVQGNHFAREPPPQDMIPTPGSQRVALTGGVAVFNKVHIHISPP